MSASSVISAMLARSPRPSAISRTAASMSACRVRALRRSSRDTLGVLAAGAASAITAPPAVPPSTLAATFPVASPRRLLPSGIPPALRVGGLIPNPLVTAGDAQPVRLDTILAGRPAVLTARRPDAALADFCRQHGLILVRISSTSGTGTPAGPGAGEDADWIDVRLAGDALPAGMRALTADPALTVIVRPDRVVAAVEPRSRLPRLPWYVPASAVSGYPAPAPSPARPEPAGPLPAAR